MQMIISKKKLTERMLVIISALQILSLLNMSNVVMEQMVLVITCVLLMLMMAINPETLGARWHLLIILANMTTIIITIVFHSGIGSAIMLVNLLLISFLFNNISISLTTYRTMHIILAVLLSAYVMTSSISTVNNTIVYDFLGNRYNSNMFAMFSLAMFLHWVCFLYTCDFKKRTRNVLYVVLSLAAGYYIVISHSRTSLLAILLFWILVIKKRFPFKNKHYRYVSTFALLFGCLFPVVYVWLSRELQEVVVLGKNLFSGRQIVWKSAMEEISKYPLFGSGNDFMFAEVGGGTTASAHNMMLGILKMFGIIPAVSIMLFLVNTNYINNRRTRNRIPQFAFLASLICTLFESFYTNSYLYLLFSVFLISFIDERPSRKRNKISLEV